MRYLAASFFLILTTSVFSGETETKMLPPASTSLTIDAKARAQDLKETFELFKKEKTGPKVNIQLSNQTTISNILEFNVTQNGTIIIIRTNTMQGIKYMMVNVEDIVNISAQ